MNEENQEAIRKNERKSKALLAIALGLGTFGLGSAVGSHLARKKFMKDEENNKQNTNK